MSKIVVGHTVDKLFMEVRFLVIKIHAYIYNGTEKSDL